MPQSSKSENKTSKKQREGVECRALVVSCFDHEDRGGMFSETSVDFEQTTRHYMLEDMSLYNLRCKNKIISDPSAGLGFRHKW
jgi:hypothetical protein